jgi:hypothetical protein
MKKRDLIHYSGAAGIFLLVIFIMLYLAHNPIPSDNKDIIVSIIGMIVGSLSVVIYAIIGRNPDEVADLTSKVEAQQKQIETLVEQKDAYEAQMIKLQSELINKLALAGEAVLNKVMK